MQFPLCQATSRIHYVVEEHSMQGQVTFAWNFETQREAEELLLNEVQNNGHERLYTAFVWVD